MHFLQMYTPFFIHYSLFKKSHFHKNSLLLYSLQGVSLCHIKRIYVNSLLNFCTTSLTIDIKSL